MKTKISYSLLAAAMACGIAQGAETAYTTPVGYITNSIIGTTTAGTTAADTYISATLVNPNVFAAASTVMPSGTSITFSGNVPTALNNTYVLEITEGVGAGFWSTVVSSNATSITVSDAFPAGVAANTKVAVRLHTTLENLFGDNTPGLIGFDGLNPNDEVQILNPQTQEVQAYVYITSQNSFFNLLTGPADGAVILPGSAVKIRRIGAANLTFTSAGSVKVTPTEVDVFNNFNWIGTPLAANGTLGVMALASQLRLFDGSNPNDELQLIRPTQNADAFVAVNPGGGPQMFSLLTGPANSEPFPEGTGAVLLRPAALNGVITIPGSTVLNP